MDKRPRDPLELPEPSAAINARRVTRSQGHIARMRALTHDTFEVVVACSAPHGTIAARAGQFATLKVEGVELPRPYSFARDPRLEAPGEYRFYIRLVAGGEMSSWLTARDRSGTAIEITGPLGAFLLDDSDAPMLLIAGGSGLSAVKALAEEACRRQQARDCLFLHGARTAADLYAAREIAQLAADWHPQHRFEFVQVLSEEPAASGWSGARGLVTEYLRQRYLAPGALATATLRAWLCGPPPMVEAGLAVLRDAGVPATHIRRDVFEDARSPAPVIDNRQCVLCDECLLVMPVAHCIVEAQPATGQHAMDYAPIVPGHSSGLYYNSLRIDAEQCIRCYACVNACPHGAISPSFSASWDTLRGAS